MVTATMGALCSRYVAQTKKAPSGRELARERLRENARLWRFYKVGKFILLLHPKFGGRYPKQKLTFSLRALPLPPDGATPLPERGFRAPTPDKKILFPLLCQLPYPLFCAGRRRKEKLTKDTPRRDAPKETF